MLCYFNFRHIEPYIYFYLDVLCEKAFSFKRSKMFKKIRTDVNIAFFETIHHIPSVRYYQKY